VKQRDRAVRYDIASECLDGEINEFPAARARTPKFLWKPPLEISDRAIPPSLPREKIRRSSTGRFEGKLRCNMRREGTYLEFLGSHPPTKNIWGRDYLPR